jgi:hypothetical protein
MEERNWLSVFVGLVILLVVGSVSEDKRGTRLRFKAREIARPGHDWPQVTLKDEYFFFWIWIGGL